jgi:hypothetical protein
MIRAADEIFGACRAASDILRTKEDNLKQMNAIYDSNPNILQDFHSALQNGISVHRFPVAV